MAVDLPVHTGLLRLERRLYHVGDLELPAPVTLLEAAVFLGALVALVAVSWIVGLGLDPSWAWTYAVLPWLAMRAASTTVMDRKRLHLWALSQVRHFLAEPRLLARLRPVAEPAELRLRVVTWQPRRRRRTAAVATEGHPLAGLGQLRMDYVASGRPARRHQWRHL